jgi:hypothetical protein
MIVGIRQKTVVGEGGKIERLSSELFRGTLVEPEEQDTTEHLLSTEANRNHPAVEQAELKQMEELLSVLADVTTEEIEAGREDRWF